MSLDILTNSRLKAYRRCPRLHHLRYERGYLPAVDAETLRFGDLFHQGLEAWWLTAGDDRLADAIAAVRAVDSDPFDLVKAEELLLGYHVRWGSENYEVIGVEVEFRAPLCNPETGAASRTFQQGGKLDVLIRDERRRVLIVEHKTSSEEIGAGSIYWQRLRMDGQVSGYFDGAAALGHPAEACLYDVIKKPGIRPLKATPEESRKYTKGGLLYANQRESDETPDEYRARLRADIEEKPDAYYQRGEVVRLEADMAEHAFDIWQTGRLIRESQLAARAPRNPDGCFQYGRLCSFFDVCTGAASLDDTARFVRVNNPHTELSMEAA